MAILFNGEIYNFRAERNRLAAAGVQFTTQTDTEVILQLYLAERLKFVDRLRGMFAIALFDWRETSSGGLPTLTLLRGPLGIKPLYVATANDDARSVLFASEIRALVATGLVSRRVSQEAVAQYLTHGFVIQPQTILADVRMLQPGTIEQFFPDGRHEQRRYWQTPAYIPRRETLDESAERLRGVLEESVALHAFADAPVGAFLSGGVDSTGIVALMRKHISDLRTFTLRCPDVQHQDEAEFATAMATQLGCQSTVVDITGQDIRELLPQFGAAQDQPSRDGLNTWLVSRAAGQQVKAVLSGVGGDEFFAGYPVTRRMAFRNSRKLGRLMGVAAHLAASVAPLLPSGRLRDRAENLASRRSPLSIWLHAHRIFGSVWARQLAGLPPLPEGLNNWFRHYFAQFGDDADRETPIGLSCLLDFRVFMGSQLLRDSDVMSMTHSLELRTPFVDVEVVNFSRSCDDSYKLNLDGGASGQYGHSGAKRVLIRALQDVLPADMANRPKLGFALPHKAWMSGPLYPLLVETCSLATVKARGLVDPQLVAPLVRNADAIRRHAHPRLWSLMLLELWCRSALDAPRRHVLAAA